jgi:hypothetical protein
MYLRDGAFANCGFSQSLEDFSESKMSGKETCQLMDLNTIANFCVAGGTLLMAYYSAKNISASNKQLKFLKKQTDLFLLQQQPDIQITNFSFDGNQLNLTLFNSGNGAAYDIAVSSSFDVVKPFNRAISEPQIKKFVLDTDSGDFPINLKTGEQLKLIPSTLVFFPYDEENSNSLQIGISRVFQCDPLFYLKTKKDRFGSDPDYIAKAIPFDELRLLLLEDKIEEISVVFRLFSKDKLQNVKSHQRISNFVVKLLVDETLENANKRGKRGPYP